jgi:suppressor of cytokine signaling 7
MTLHCRIDYKDKYWSFSGLSTTTHYSSLPELIEDTVKQSEEGIIGVVKQNSNNSLQPPFTVRLQKPLNRFYEVTSLQNLCRFAILQNLYPEHIAQLPLPKNLIDFLGETFYEF